MVGSPVTVPLAIETLGNDLVDVVAGRLSNRIPVESVSISDPSDIDQQLAGAIVLGVGVAGAGGIEELLAVAIEQRAAAVVLREPVEISPAVLRAVVNADLVVLGLIPGVDWTHVASSLSKLLEASITGHAPDDGSPFSDLSATEQLSQTADALADLLDAPVTIEDTNSRVLAFSRNQIQGDDYRKETILHREVPKVYRDQMKAEGVFKKVYSSTRPVYLDALELHGHHLSRTVMRVMVGKVIVGSIWVASTGRLSDTDNELLLQTSHEVARILEHVHLESGRESSLRRNLVTQLMAGGREADKTVRRMGLAENAFCLIVLGFPGHDEQGTEGDSRRVMQMADNLNLHLLSYNSSSVAAAWGGGIVGVLSVDVSTPDSFTLQVAQRFIERSRKDMGLHLVVSPIVARASDLKMAKDEAIRALQVLNSAPRPSPSISTVSRTEDVFIDVILMEIRERFMESWATGPTPIRRLVEYDRDHNTSFVATLNAHLTHFGAVIQAAASIHVHPNTFRYRLKRLHEISGIDGGDGESRFRALLELKLLSLGHDSLNLRSVDDRARGRQAAHPAN